MIAVGLAIKAAEPLRSTSCRAELLKFDSGDMKVLVVLVLAVFSGCQANLFYADAPKPQLEVLTDAFWDYVSKATKTADDTLQMVRSSQFGQDVSARLTESTDIANKYAASLQEQLPPAAQELITKRRVSTKKYPEL